MPVCAARSEPLAALAATPPPGGAERGEQILEIAEVHLALGLVSPTLRTLGIPPIIIPLWPLGTALVDFAAIVSRPLLGVRQQIVRGRNRFEPRFRFGLSRVQIGVKFLGELAVDLADLVGAGVRFYAEYLIGCLRRRHPGLALFRALALCGGRDLFDANRHVAFRAAPLARELDRVADPRQADAVAQLGPAAHRRPVDRNHEVVGSQPGAFGRRAGLHPRNHRALGVLGAESRSDIGCQVLDRHPDAATLDLTVLDQLVHDLASHIDRDGKADTNITATRCHYRRIDADDPSLQIDQRASRIARIDRGVGLDEILIAFDAGAAPERADDPRGHGLAEAERIADREDKIADLQAIGVADRNSGQTTAGDLQQGNVGIGIAADQFRFEMAIVLGRDLDAVRVLDDVGIRHHITLGRIDDDARAGRLGLALDRLALAGG